MTLNVQYVEVLMERKGWSMRRLASRAGLSAATVSRIISGRRGAGTRALAGFRKAFPEEPVDKLFILL